MDYLISDVKSQLHIINQHLYPVPRPRLHQEIRMLWGVVHDFRLHYEASETDFYFSSLQKVAGQCNRMGSYFVDVLSQPDGPTLVKEYLVLRRYVSTLEKSIVKQFYYWDTGVISQRIVKIPQAAKIANKSEVTIRRYIREARIKSYQLIKIWWIPIEELQNKRGKP